MESQVTHGPRQQRARKWRIAFIVVTITTIVFYIIGGALVGASYNCLTDEYYYVGQDLFYDVVTCRKNGEWGAGVAFIVLACFSAIAWVILLVLRFTSWYRQPLAPGVQQPSTYGNQQPSTYDKQQPIASTNMQPTTQSHSDPITQPTPVAAQSTAMPHVQSEKSGITPASVELAPATHFCAKCEHQTSGTFCGNCGEKVE